MLELQATNAALDAIARRHGFDGFHLVGQSGGATLVGGVLGMRRDIGCAVIGAGRVYNPHSQWPKGPTGQTIDLFNPADGVSFIANQRNTRVMVITDPADQRVSEKNQTPFVQMLRLAGGKVDHFLVQATDEKRHGVTPYSLAVATACIRGDASQDIAQNLAKFVEKRVAAKAEQTKAEQAKTEQAKSEQTKPEPAKVEPTKAAPANMQTQLRPQQPPFR